MKKTFILFVFSFLMLFSINIHASEATDKPLPNILESEIIDGNITITVESEEDLIIFQEWVEENNRKVKELWDQSEQRQTDTERSPYLMNGRSSLTTSSILTKQGPWNILPRWAIAYYCTYYTSSNRITSVSNIYAEGLKTVGGTSEVKNLEKDIRLLDSSRTIAANVSCYVTVKLSGLELTEAVDSYMEWYVSGGGNIY